MHTLIYFTVLFTAFALPAAVTDIKELRIPNWYTLAGVPVLLIFVLYFTRTMLVSSLEGAAAALFVFYLVRIFTKKGLGMGDIKFSILCGFYCGFPDVFVSFLFAAFAGIIFFISVSCKNKRIDGKMKIPFAPFMAGGAVAGKFILFYFPIH